MANLPWPLMYVCCAIAWTFIETNHVLERLEGNSKHWINRSMTAIRSWAKTQPQAISVGGRILASFVLSILAWLPVLLVSAIWPAALIIYVLSNITKRK